MTLRPWPPTFRFVEEGPGTTWLGVSGGRFPHWEFLGRKGGAGGSGLFSRKRGQTQKLWAYSTGTGTRKGTLCCRFFFLAPARDRARHKVGGRAYAALTTGDGGVTRWLPEGCAMRDLGELQVPPRPTLAGSPIDDGPDADLEICASQDVMCAPASAPRAGRKRNERMTNTLD